MITGENEGGSIIRNASFFKQLHPGTDISNCTDSLSQDMNFDHLTSDSEPMAELSMPTVGDHTSFSDEPLPLCPESDPLPVRRSVRERKAPSRLIEEV